jgi:Leucine-rich repeat (LRR) protein
MARCNLSEIDGLGSLTSLRELYLAFNQITSLDALSMLENLEILDIEG